PQVTPISNFFLSGSYTMQPFLGSMEGAVLSGKLTALGVNKSFSVKNSSSDPMPSIQPATNAATA
ncbi:MAG: FAD-dependent oxidoreductase, partial [Cyanobacteria bacterium J06641_2]